jgi:hypothetical protein
VVPFNSVLVTVMLSGAPELVVVEAAEVEAPELEEAVWPAE